jgi:hypothetical protein
MILERNNDFLILPNQEELDVLLESESSGTDSNEVSGNKSVEDPEEGTPQKTELIIK